MTLVRNCSTWHPSYLIPGLHSVQILEAVHFLQFSWHRLKMLESGRHTVRESYTAHNRNQKSGCIKKKKKKQQGNRGERVMKSISWSRMCEEDQRVKLWENIEKKRQKGQKRKKKKEEEIKIARWGVKGSVGLKEDYSVEGGWESGWIFQKAD